MKSLSDCAMRSLSFGMPCILTGCLAWSRGLCVLSRLTLAGSRGALLLVHREDPRVLRPRLRKAVMSGLHKLTGTVACARSASTIALSPDLHSTQLPGWVQEQDHKTSG